MKQYEVITMRLLALLWLVIPSFAQSQTVIHMIEDMGVYKIPCQINGFKVNMVFDTGASTVCISRSFAEMLFDNGYLTEDDIVGNAQMMIADGRIVDRTIVMLDSVKIGGVTIKNVKASVTSEIKTPLLLGQSAIRLLGDFSIKGNKLYILDKVDTLSVEPPVSHLERWDKINYVYFNHTYGFGWNLPREVAWTKVMGQSKYTQFKADGGFVVARVAVRPAGTTEQSAWGMYDKLVAMSGQIDASVEKRTGTIVYERTFEKCKLFNIQSIKTTFKTYFKDDRFQNPDEVYTESYMFFKDGFLYTVTVELAKSVYESYESDEFLAEIFRGFNISLK